MKPKKYSSILLMAALAAVLFMAAPSVMANSVVDDYGTVWSVVREFNKSSNGWDLRLIVNGHEERTIWITQDPTPDQDPVIALDPFTGKPVVYWSRQVGFEYRIFHSVFERGMFSEPAAITAGGTDFSDHQPYVEFDEFGQCHLVWYRQQTDGTGVAFYTRCTEGSWTDAEQLSVLEDNVIGTVTIHAPSGEHDFFRGTYQYLKPATGKTATREVCRGGDTSPWSVCH